MCCYLFNLFFALFLFIPCVRSIVTCIRFFKTHLINVSSPDKPFRLLEQMLFSEPTVFNYLHPRRINLYRNGLFPYHFVSNRLLSVCQNFSRITNVIHVRHKYVQLQTLLYVSKSSWLKASYKSLYCSIESFVG